MENEFQYQRLIVAYHGCERETRDRVLLGSEKLKPSQKAYDWLGNGIYFWEHGVDRAKNWAETRYGKGLKKPAVLGALIQLGNCFDLLDTRYTRLLNASWPDFEQSFQIQGKPLPINKPSRSNDVDAALRILDCAMINWAVSQAEQETGGVFDTVRGVFQEGEPAFPNSYILDKSHIQIAVRNPACILGYFRPD
jgi:hypothetical protein